MINQLSYAVSPLQQAMLLPSLIAQDSGAYLEQVIWYWQEDLDNRALKESWQQVTKYYEILRTYFDWQSSAEIRQIIASEVEIIWKEFDWSSLSLVDQEQKIGEYLERDRSQGFHLDQPPLMHFALCKLGKNNYQLIWTFHHSILDGKSIILLFKEVFTYYQAHQQQYIYQPPSVIPYREFIEFINNQPKNHGQHFWQNLLAGFTKKNNLSTQNIQESLKEFSCISKKSGNQSSNQSIKGDNSYSINLSPEITAKLQTLAKENNFTLNNLIQGIYALALGQCSGSNDVVFGATRACRRLAIDQVETMLGLLINTVPVRVKINPELTLIELFQELRSQWIAMRDYETTSLTQIHQWRELESGQNLFDTLVVFENYDLTHALDLPNCQVEIKEQINIPLSLTGYGGEQLSLVINYDSEIYSHEAIDLFLTYINELVIEFCLNPYTKIMAIQENIFQKRQLTFIDLFSQQVQANPQQLAVVSQNHHLTYQQLDHQSTLLALKLREAGVKAEILVGICGDRSIEMIVGILAILKAGGAYVPIDPEYPLDRINFILEDTQTPVLLTQSHLLPKLVGVTNQVICLDQLDLDSINSVSSLNPLDFPEQLLVNNSNICTKPDSNSLAYVIYTSGSTGKPKGVMIEHGSLGNFVQTATAEYGVKGSDRILQFSSLSFDIAVEEIFLALGNGGSLYLRTPEMASSIALLLEKCQAWGITILDLPTAYWHQLVEILTQGQLPSSLRLVIVGGEKMERSRVALWQKLVGDYPLLINSYGPTEATVGVTTQWINGSKGVKDLTTEIPIGYPLPGVETYILDEAYQPVVPGTVGELYLGGISLARGYWQRPDLTAKKFLTLNIPDNLAGNLAGDITGNSRDNAGQAHRLYQTGDLVQQLPDGRLMYLGRTDYREKIGGFLVELAEVEVTLQQHPQVRDVVVMGRDSATNSSAYLGAERYLVAFVVLRSPEVLGQLQGWLQSKLPQYMVPRFYQVLDQLPMTVNGKIDRPTLQKLPLQEMASSGLSNSAQLASGNIENPQSNPQSELEKKLLVIWQEVLRNKQIGVEDNFFQLGGSSLVALRLFSHIEREFQKNLPLTTLIQAPTIRQLAALLQSQGWRVSWRSIVPIQTQGSKTPLFCIHPVGGNVLCYNNLIPYLSPEQPVYGLQAQGLDGVEEAIDDIKIMARNYLREIQTIQPHGPYILAGYSFGGVVAYEIAQRLQQAGEEVAALIFFDVIHPQVYRAGVPPIAQRVAIHGSNLAKLDTAQKLDYFKNRVGKKATSIQEKLHNYFDRILGKQDLTSISIPVYLKKLETSHNQAIRRYSPNFYHGRVIQLQTIERPANVYPSLSLGWQEVVKNPVEIVRGIPGHHGTMLEPPQVDVLGEKLQRILDSLHLS